MDPSILERKISNLETSLGSLEIWLAVMTALVVLGLILEYWQEIPHAIADLKRAKKWLWKPVCIIIGAILITIGVAGELFVQFKASRKETELRKANDEIFTGLNAEAAIARQNAGKLEKEAAGLQEAAQREQLARIEIQEKVEWRRLATTQQRKIASHLTSFSTQVANLWYNADDLEANTFVLDIVAALRLAKWNVSNPQGVSRLYPPSSLPLATGIFVGSTGDAASRAATDALVHELSCHGFDVIKSSQTEPSPIPTVSINVEHRPEGAQGEAKVRKAANHCI